MYLILQPIEIKTRAKEGAESLKKLHNHLKTQKSSTVDSLFQKHSLKITEQVDCTTCGNCCKVLEAGVAEDEITRLSKIKNVSAEYFKVQFLQKEAGSEASYLKDAPCMFLKENCLCSIYEDRPNACRRYPGLHYPGIKYRLRSVWANYEICPIVYASVEAVKSDLSIAP